MVKLAFSTDARNLVPDDRGGHTDVFVRDLRDGTTDMASVGVRGKQPNGDSLQPSISGSGRFVAFVSTSTNLIPSDTNHLLDVFVRRADRWQCIASQSAKVAG